MHTPILLALTGATLALANPAPAPADPKITPAPGLLAMRDSDVAPRQFTVTDLAGTAFNAGDAICTAELFSLAANAPTPTGAIRTWLRTVAAGLSLPTDLSGPVDDSLTTLCAKSASMTPPATLSSAYESYTSKFNSWASGVADEVHSIASDCGGQVSAMVELLIVTDEESCTKAVLGFVDAYEGFTSTVFGGTSSTTTGKATGKTASKTSTTATAGQTTVNKGGDGTSTSGASSGTTGAPQSTGGSQGQSGSGAASSTSSSTGGATGPRETGFVAAAAAVAVGVAGVVAAL